MMDIMEAARYIIYLSYHVNVKSLTPLKLQKILYLAQGWSYVWDNCPLFSDEFEAWQYGPVNAQVYNYFRGYGREEIPEHEGDDGEFLDPDLRETLDFVWDKYCSYSAFELVKMTHKQEPWINAYNNNETIRNRDIKRFFQAMY